MSERDLSLLQEITSHLATSRFFVEHVCVALASKVDVTPEQAQSIHSALTAFKEMTAAVQNHQRAIPERSLKPANRSLPQKVGKATNQAPTPAARSRFITPKLCMANGK